MAYENGRVDIANLSGLAQHCLSECVIPDYEVLNYGKVGVEALFKEFKRISSHLVRLQEQMSNFALRRSEIVLWLKGERAQLERGSEAVLLNKLPDWVSRGYAMQERLLLAKVGQADQLHQLKELELLMEHFDNIHQLLQGKAKQMMEFKQDARFVQQVLNFANILQELR